MTVRAPTGGKLISRTVTTVDDTQFGKVVRYVWPKEPPNDKNPLDCTAAYVYQANRVIQRTVTTTTTHLGKVLPPNPAGGRGGAGGGGGRGVIPVGLGAPIRFRFEAGGQGVGGVSGARSSSPKAGEQVQGGDGRVLTGKGSGDVGPGAGAKGFLIISRNRSLTPRVIGLKGEQLDVTDEVVVEVFELVKGAMGGAGGGTRVPKSRQGRKR